jgi:hypothetical protein
VLTQSKLMLVLSINVGSFVSGARRIDHPGLDVCMLMVRFSIFIDRFKPTKSVSLDNNTFLFLYMGARG